MLRAVTATGPARTCRGAGGGPIAPNDDRSGPTPTRDAADVEAGFSILHGDPLHRAQRAVRLVPGRGLGLGRRIALALIVTWLPLVVWAFWRRHLLPGEAPEPLLQHFAIHARFLLALPLFLVAEATVETALRRIGPQFLSSGLVDDALRPGFVGVVRDADRLRRSPFAIGAIVALVVAAGALGIGRGTENHELAWAVEGASPGAALGFGGLWFELVSRPVFTLVLLAWVWRFVVLAHLFGRIARLDLRLAPTHPDRAGGLAFMEALPAALAPLFLGAAVVVGARWGHDAVYHGLDVRTLQIPAGVLVAASVLVGLAPLLAFAGTLRALRRRSLASFGALVGEYGRLVERRWIRRETVDDRGLLSAPEIGPVADVAAIYAAVRDMRAVPIGRRSILPLALAALLPLLPVFATQMPLKEILAKILAPLLGF